MPEASWAAISHAHTRAHILIPQDKNPLDNPDLYFDGEPNLGHILTPANFQMRCARVYCKARQFEVQKIQALQAAAQAWDVARKAARRVVAAGGSIGVEKAQVEGMAMQGAVSQQGLVSSEQAGQQGEQVTGVLCTPAAHTSAQQQGVQGPGTAAQLPAPTHTHTHRARQAQLQQALQDAGGASPCVKAAAMGQTGHGEPSGMAVGGVGAEVCTPAPVPVVGQKRKAPPS